MGAIAEEAEADSNVRIQGRALTALAEATLDREGDVQGATERAERALAVLDADDHVGRFGALDARSRIAWYEARITAAEEFESAALDAARAAGRKDLESKAARELAVLHLTRMDEERAAPLIERALELAEESGSIVARAESASVKGEFHRHRADWDEAEEWLTKALDLFNETGSQRGIAATSKSLGRIAWHKGEPAQAERLLRDSIRLVAPIQERGMLCESQRLLAQLLLEEGRVDEAEKYALAARETVSAEDLTSRATTRVALAQVRAAQDRDGEAEELFRQAVDIVTGAEHCRIGFDVLPAYAEFLRARGREDEADELDERLEELTPSAA
jgi:tetratricopeptide (TPR) repeat protein